MLRSAFSGSISHQVTWSRVGSILDHGPLRRGLQRQTGRVLAVGLPIRRQRPADESPGARLRGGDGTETARAPGTSWTPCDGHADGRLATRKPAAFARRVRSGSLVGPG